MRLSWSHTGEIAARMHKVDEKLLIDMKCIEESQEVMLVFESEHLPLEVDTRPAMAVSSKNSEVKSDVC